MMMNRLTPRFQLVFLSIIFFATACIPQATPTPFRPPTKPAPTQILSTITPIPAIYTAVPTPTITATATESPCSNNLEFLEDITVPDGTIISFGGTIDKQWLVKNNGTCDWDSTYRLKWFGGDPLGAAQEQILFPAKAGTQATLRIIFTAPTVEGSFESAWQAYDPDGIAFGDPVFIKIVVSP
jgi:Ig-like domain from next to BRCA1 gene